VMLPEVYSTRSICWKETTSFALRKHLIFIKLLCEYSTVVEQVSSITKRNARHAQGYLGRGSFWYAVAHIG
jgi:hypothetical protein